MAAAFRCDICNELFLEPQKQPLEVYIQRHGGSRVHLQIDISKGDGSGQCDVCPSCFTVAIAAATEFLEAPQ